MERLEQLGEDALIYRFEQPQPDGRRVRIVYRRFRHRYPRTTRRFWVAQSAEVIAE